MHYISKSKEKSPFVSKSKINFASDQSQAKNGSLSKSFIEKSNQNGSTYDTNIVRKSLKFVEKQTKEVTQRKSSKQYAAQVQIKSNVSTQNM